MIRTAPTIVLLALLAVAPCRAVAADPPVVIELVPRSPEQMSAFYEARGFPDSMIARLAEECFITVRIHNTGDRVLWLDLAKWRFETGGAPLERYHRRYWKARWQAMDIPLASQSTFRWTLLPELLDYQPGEREGGNIILPRVTGPIRLHAVFDTGADRQGPPVDYHADDIHCAENAP